MKKDNPTRLDICEIRKAEYADIAYLDMIGGVERSQLYGLIVGELKFQKFDKMIKELREHYKTKFHKPREETILDFLGFKNKKELKEYVYLKLGISSEKE